jgi:ferrochelatase
MSKKVAVVLFNLGGPDKLTSVKEFLFNLFYDPAIIRLPNPFRWCIAKLISSKRENTAKDIYKQIGGGSPILAITQKQAELIEKELNIQNNLKLEFKLFISMRYWHPRAKEVIKKVEKFSPEKIVYFPLYPQYSTTTTKSSFEEFSKFLNKSNLKNIPLKIIYSYYQEPNFIKAHAELIYQTIKDITGNFRILFSAHGLPEYIVKNGDPYQQQIEETVELVVKELAQIGLDYVICYQSKVGPLKWIGPSTEEELLKAARDKVSVAVVPIAFVSDHSETLVELDIEYKELFEKNSKKSYLRVPALNENKNFILSVAQTILEKSQ